MAGIAAPVIAGLAVGISFVILFSMLSTVMTGMNKLCSVDPIVSPQLRLSVDEGDEYFTEGTISGECIEPVLDYVPIVNLGNVSNGSVIALTIENYSEPDRFTVIIQNASVYERELTVAEGGTIPIPEDIPPGRYGLIVQANWYSIHIPFSTVTYLFQITVE